MPADKPDEARPRFPAAVRVAAVVWLVRTVAALAVLYAGLYLFWPGWPVPPPSRMVLVVTACVVYLAHLVCPPGRVWRGRAEDTQLTATLSLAGGVVLLLFGAAVGWSAVWAWAGAPGVADALVISAGVLFAFGVLSVAAGTLGLVGRQQYLLWRKHHRPPVRRPPRPRRYDDNEDNIDNSGPRHW